MGVPLVLLGVPVAVPTLEYWPTTAMPLALKTQVSPASSNPSEFRSPTFCRREDRDGVDSRNAVADRHARERVVAVVGALSVQVTLVPAGTYRPGGLSLLLPLVSLTMLMFVV